MTEVLIALAVFVAAYALIASDRIDRTLAALLGALLMVILGVVGQEEAFAAIDLEVIFLLAGMMILAGILRRTGFLQWVAIRSVKLVDGDPVRLLLALAAVSAVLSALLDNVTTVVLIAPVTVYIASVMRVSPVPYLVTEILASNIGGTATLIGDPPNILIGAASGLSFADFLVNLAPIVVVIFVVFLVTVVTFFRKDLTVDPDVREVLLSIDEGTFISDQPLLRLSLLVIGLTLLGFLLSGALGLQPATIALFGAVVLVLLARVPLVEALEEVEWPTLLFFVGLFMLVEGIVHVGIVDALGDALLEVTRGDPAVTTLGLLWLSGVASAIIDNIPYTATMIPIVFQMGESGIPIEPLWWALALGACLGGNATIVGASANIVVANISAGAGHPILFRQYFRYGFIIVVESLVISSVYLWLRYLS
jgi:Na+/H+ antiporter NhaD/arsenite permease-like protein